MPTIQSRKYPDNIQFVTADAWENEFKPKGLARRFRVIDDSDIQDTVIPAPESITNFGPIEDTVAPVLERQEIKDKLDLLEVEYNPRASTEKLLELLNSKQ